MSSKKYARTAGEIDRAFRAYIDKKGGQFEYRQGGRTDRIATYLLGILEDYLGLFETDAKKVVLYHDNQPKFDRIIDLALDEYMKVRHLKRGRAVRPLKQYEWSVPEERVYDSETNHAVSDIANHALDPYVRLNDGGSRQEDEFVAFLEANTQYIDWWYKNGDSGRQNYAVEYDRNGEKALFYVDFVIRMRSGRVYLSTPRPRKAMRTRRRSITPCTCTCKARTPKAPTCAAASSSNRKAVTTGFTVGYP